ncbi:MAG TPA: DegQ family serine endoprotease [Verrucomicrobiota bacterium]|nr:DegQ family serine endoprotease [Verrucomicrobiota bacterium]HOP96346.1 DegQ family serine endoprotease [Verrucomicrobiota bacterium]
MKIFVSLNARRRIAAMLAIGVAASCSSQESTNHRELPEIKYDPSPIQRQAGLNSFAPVVSNAAPGVVSIFTRRTVRNRIIGPFLDDPFLRRFFGGNGGNLPEIERQQRGLGSGVLVSEDGYILSNYHVVEGAEEITVETANGREFTAKLIGTDPPTDIAVLRIDARNLPAATFADSSQLRVGDVVLAIGNPFGIGQTVTAGIVSGTDRTGFGITEYEDFIQTDASINPGNSGGALTDAQGRVVGINTAILTRTGGSQGVGFAVPVNLARAVMEQIIRNGRVVRGYIGVFIQPVTPALAEAFDVPENKGALVGGVSPDSPGEKAGLREGDVIVEFNGKPVENARDLRFRVSQTPPGTKAPLVVLRDGKKQELNITLGELPREELAMGGAAPGEEQTEAGGFLEGLELQELTPLMRQQLNIPRHLNGLIIISVEPGTPAFRATLREGDILLEINRKPVRTIREAAQALRQSEGPVLLRVWSQGGMRYVVIQRNESG